MAPVFELKRKPTAYEIGVVGLEVCWSKNVEVQIIVIVKTETLCGRTFGLYSRQAANLYMSI